MSYMGIDLGTSGCRVIAIDEKGEIIASEKMSYQLKHGKNFFIELIPQDVLTAFEACVYKVNAKVKKDPVCSLSFSVIGVFAFSMRLLQVWSRAGLVLVLLQ